VLIKDLTVAQLQSTFVCDKVFRGPDQKNDPALSPVSVAFATSRGLMNPYVMPTLQQLFNFVTFYTDYYRTGPGSSHPDANRRWRNAAKVRFNIETKINPRQEFANRTIEPKPFARIVARTIMSNGLEDRADIQSKKRPGHRARWHTGKPERFQGDLPDQATTEVRGSG